MRRVAVLGCAGAGKTTLARALGERLGLPVLHIDEAYWRTDDRFGAEWPSIHAGLIAGDAWIIDGMKPGVLPERLARADTAIFLDLPRRTCFRGLLERRLSHRRGVPSESGAVDSIDWPLVRWMWRFPRVVRPVVLESLHTCSCDVVTLRSRDDVRRFLGALPPPQHEERSTRIRDGDVNHV